MTVSDRRLPPFAWISLAALKLIRERLPTRSQQAARNALLALAEAASLRHDGQHRQGDTLLELSALSGVSERRLRDHLAELEELGLVRVERRVDDANRDLPTKYVLTEPPGSDETSDRPDETTSKRPPKRPTHRARVNDEKSKNTEPPPPPEGGRSRDHAAHRRDLAAWAQEHYPDHAPDLVAQRVAWLPPGTPASALEALLTAGPTDELASAWQRVREALELSVPNSTYRIWLEPLEPHALLDDSTLVVTAPAEVYRWVRDRFDNVLQSSVADVLGAGVRAHVVNAG